MPRITVVATLHPVPLPDGRFVRTAAEEPAGLELELDLFVRRRMDAGELVERPAEQASEMATPLPPPEAEKPADPKSLKPSSAAPRKEG